MSTVLFYYRVLYSDGTDFYEKARASIVRLPCDHVIVDFLENVLRQNPEDIGKFPLSLFKVYRDFGAFEKRTGHSDCALKFGSPITGMGAKEEPVILVVPDEEDLPLKKRLEISDLTTRLKSFENAQLVEGCIQSQDETFLPYPHEKIKKLYVRKCYEDVFGLLLDHLNRGFKAFAISGTPGIGKSLFFVYILYRLMADSRTKSLPLKPNRIVYQVNSSLECFDLQRRIVTVLSEWDASFALEQQDTFYIVDGRMTKPYASTCSILFISSPSEQYMDFVEHHECSGKQRIADEWFFPVWTLDELHTCQRLCYPNLSFGMLKERHRVYGGVARFVFHSDYCIPVPKIMSRALDDVSAVMGIRNILPFRMSPNTQTILHLIVSNDGKYQFLYVDLASKYVGEQLWIRHFAHMRANLQDMNDYNLYEISRHLFEIYGHMAFSQGRRTLKCRCLESGTVIDIDLDVLHGKRILIEKDSITTEGIHLQNINQSTVDDINQANDSLCPLGMFQFIVAAEYPFCVSDILRKLCNLYDEPKIFFVVPPNLFGTLKKQIYKAQTGTDNFAGVCKLKQYVVELPIVERILDY